MMPGTNVTFTYRLIEGSPSSPVDAFCLTISFHQITHGPQSESAIINLGIRTSTVPQSDFRTLAAVCLHYLRLLVVHPDTDDFCGRFLCYQYVSVAEETP